MSTAENHQVHIHQNNLAGPPGTGKSATSSGVFALALAGVAILSAPVFLLIPYIGFLPALIAGAGALVAGLGLRGSSRGTGTAVTGLIVSVIVFALLAGIATMWNLVVADPAIRDYDELQEVIEYIKQLVFG
ncbi:hypothetical protein [Kocuria palustris]|uniref:hypothetical protein n=1 Tax=Kocuria palustris TaxID=71999 RepID=UPI00077B6FDC|nr:hypothetical protein [Kocuria palustris]